MRKGGELMKLRIGENKKHSHQVKNDKQMVTFLT